MILPHLTNRLISHKISPALKGINKGEDSENCVINATNLSFEDICKTRSSRKSELILSFVPHQKLVIGDFLYLRHYNTLYKLTTNSQGELKDIVALYELKDYQSPPDRIIMDIEGELCILPDGLRIKGEIDSWISVGEGLSNKVLFPFTDSRNLFYTSGASGEEYCDDAVMFNVGGMLKFSWAPLELYRIIRKERVISITDDSSELTVGYSITLDREVTGWNSIPQNSSLEFGTPAVTSLINPLHLGIDRAIGFSGNHIFYSAFKGSYSYITDAKSYINVGQRVNIAGSSIPYNNKVATVTEISDGIIYFDTDFKDVTEALGKEIIITPIMPSFDEALYYDRRVIGIDNSDRTLWISAENNPFCFYREISEKKDSAYFYCEDYITAIKVFKGSIICFSESGGFRILGDNALNFSKSPLSVSGISKDCKGSIAQASDSLIYSSPYGIMEFSSGRDNKVSSPLGFTPIILDAAVSKGNYYGLCSDCIYVYNPYKKRWWREDNLNIDGVFAFKGEFYLISGNEILSSRGENISSNWELELSFLGGGDFSDIIPQKLFCRLKSNSAATIKFYMESPDYDKELTLTEEQIIGERVLQIPIKRLMCSKLKIRLIGNGNCQINKLTLQYRRI